ncbi:Spore germination protein [Luteitalea pratensis]|uniref:Spore germination protein n=1 Tax=Luteitalea pratensis TaxID=1855912 RepID=A0A143PJN0_LUTPR|nr:GerMN domain-containing protein [Luteitalea pratensis]AMY08775.1 Spore germination protein [Luteitalea pratensis]
MRRPVVVALLGVMTAVLIGIVGVVLVPRWFAPATVEVPRADAAASGEATGKIRASLFYVAEDGLHLTAVDADVPFGATPAEQARALVEAQLQPAPAPLAQSIAEGTRVRQIFIAEDGTAFVDLSKEAVTNHRGGSLDELFAVYTIVNAITVNLPAIKSVQILIDGQEVDTLAGHVDLRHPLTRNLRWVEAPGKDGGERKEDGGVRTEDGGARTEEQGQKQDAAKKPAGTPQARPVS